MQSYTFSAYSDKGMAFEINSVVISVSTDPKPDSKLSDPVTIASSNLQEVDVSWLIFLFNIEDHKVVICMWIKRLFTGDLFFFSSMVMSQFVHFGILTCKYGDSFTLPAT